MTVTFQGQIIHGSTRLDETNTMVSKSLLYRCSDLGLKTIYAIARSRRDASTVFFREALRPSGADRQGGRTIPPSTDEGGEIRKTGEG